MILEQSSIFTKKPVLYPKLIPTMGLREIRPSPKVLVVDDDPFVQFANKTALESLGCKVELADNGKEALKLTAKNHYDLIFTDISMPDLTGIEVARRIRQSECRCREVPIIAVTSHTEKEIRKECMLAGMNDMLAKPVSAGKFCELLKAYIIF